MSLSHETRYSDEQLARYLLQLLPEDDVERLDEMSIADEEIAWRLRVVEDDLVDAYVSGSLTGETLKQFEAIYLSSERRRRKVRFAGSFLERVDREAAAASITSITGAARGRGWRIHGSTTASSLATAAALLLVCGALLAGYMQMRSVLSETRAQGAALQQRARELEQQLDAQRAANAETANELARVRTEMAALQAASPRPSNPPSRTSPTLPAIALVLMPQTRAIGQIPTLVVPPATSRVTLDLRLESNRFSRYQAVLKDPASNVIVWRSGRLAAPSTSDRPSLPVVIPAAILKSQHYSVELTGDDTGSSAEVVGTYAVRIVFQ